MRYALLLSIAVLGACDAADGPSAGSSDGPPAGAEPLTEARRDALCAEVHNVYECSNLVETHLLQRGAPGVTRAGDTLTLALAGGGAHRLVDRGRGADVVLHTYDGHLAGIGYHVIQLHYYEGGAHLLVGDSTGAEVRISGPPVVSPDGRRIAIASFAGMAGYGPNLLQLRRVESGGVPVEWEREPDDWGAEAPRWLDSTTVRFTRLWVCDGQICDREAELRRVDGGWTVQPDA